MRATTISAGSGSAVEIPLAPPARAAAAGAGRRVGQGLSALAVLFLAFDAAIKLAQAAPVAEAFADLGMPFELAVGIGVLQLACIVLYLVPATSALGAVLLTGFLGGAVVLHVRVGDPLFSHVLFPTYVGALAWAGLLLRDGRLRDALLPRPRGS
ncbi:MAG TPA: DoxX family protein [Longimicrobium sp.]|jgi:hypothetical protein